MSQNRLENPPQQARLVKRMRRLFTHRCAQSDLSCYIDGELSDRRAARVAAHIQDCEDCAREFDSLQATVELLRATPAPGMPRSVVIPASAVAAQRNTRRFETTFVALRTSAISVTVILAVLLTRDAFSTLAGPAGAIANATTGMDSIQGEADSGPVALLQAAPREEVVSDAEAVVAGAAPAEAVPAEAVPAEAVSAREAAPEAVGAGDSEPLVQDTELAEGQASTQVAPEVALLAAEPPAEEPLLATEAAEMPLAKAAPESRLPRETPAFWTPLRVVAAALGLMLAALLGALVTVSRRRLAL